MLGVTSSVYFNVFVRHFGKPCCCFLKVFYVQVGPETVDGTVYDVLRIDTPITIDREITIPATTRLRTDYQLTINETVHVYGHFQDFRSSANILGSGAVGTYGTGRVEFYPGASMYIMGQ